jgi:hypothetical protein
MQFPKLLLSRPACQALKRLADTENPLKRVHTALTPNAF